MTYLNDLKNRCYCRIKDMEKRIDVLTADKYVTRNGFGVFDRDILVEELMSDRSLLVRLYKVLKELDKGVDL